MAHAMRQVLLVQFRDENDVMAVHEHTCVARRMEGQPVALARRNAHVERASPRWLEGFDGVIIGGSGAYSCYHEESRPWVEPTRELLERVLRDGLPAFGLCFGHQLLAHHLGGEVCTSAARTEIGTVDLELTPAGAQDPVFSYLNSAFRAQTGHSDHVANLPEALEVLVGNDTLPLQAFKVRGKPIYTTQFHPDMTGAEARARYLAYQDNLSAQEDAEVFRLDADEASTLLGRFIAHCLQL